MDKKDKLASRMSKVVVKGIRQRSNSVGNLIRDKQMTDDQVEARVVFSQVSRVLNPGEDDKGNSKKRNRLCSNACALCDVGIPEEGEGSDSMECDGWKRWVCFPCSKIPREVYEAINLGGFDCLTYYCPPCKVAIPSLKGIGDKLDRHITSMEKKLGNRNDSLQSSIDQQIDQKIDKKAVEIT